MDLEVIDLILDMDLEVIDLILDLICQQVWSLVAIFPHALLWVCVKLSTACNIGKYYSYCDSTA